MKQSRQSGFTLVELLIVIAIMGIVFTLAVPNLLTWTRGLKYKEAARTLASAMRDARTRAVTENREYRVLFDVDGNGSVSLGGVTLAVPAYGYAVQRGRLANNSTNFGGNATEVINGFTYNYVNGWATVMAGSRPLISNLAPNSPLVLRGTKDCNSTADVSLQFNPNGTSQTGYICVMDSENLARRRFLVGIPNVGSGRVVLSQ